MKVVIVGPCASGTSTLAERLRLAGFEAHACAQEHSYVPEMWRMTRPDTLVYLDVLLETIRRRREIDWGEQHLARENARLADAREHCDIYVQTDNLTRDQVFETVSDFLRERSGRQKAAEGHGPGPST